MQRRKHSPPADGVWVEEVTGVMTSQCRYWLAMTAGRGVRRAGRIASAGLRKGKVKSTDHRDVTFANPEIRALMTADNEVAGGFDNE